MKAFLIPVLGSVFLAGSFVLAETSAPSSVTSAAAEKGKAPSADSLLNQTLSFLIDIQQTLAGAQDKESADKAAKKMDRIQKEIQQFMKMTENLTEAEREKAEALMEKAEVRIERMTNSCKKEASRLMEAQYYGSTALKEILENSDEFSDFIELDEDAPEPSAALHEEEE